MDETDAGDGPTTDGGQPVESDDRPLGLPLPVGAALPLVLLAVLVGFVLVFPPFAGIQSGAPLPDVAVTHATMPTDDSVVLHVVNSGPEPVTISQVLVNDAYWDYAVYSGGEQLTRPYTLGPAQSARIVVPYHWQEGWDLHTTLVLADGATFGHTIVAPTQTPGVTSDVLTTLALVGLLVGIIPVVLGMLWFPFMRRLPDRAIHAVLLFAVGVLGFLAFDAGFEAFEVAESIPGVFEGTLLVVLGIVGAFLLVQAVSAWQGEEPSPLALAYLVALGIGLHNLAEGLAIGGAFALGRVSLGAFLVVGFMVHNVTEGPAVVAPLAREERPGLHHFAAMGLLAGAPIIVGGWIGSLATSPTLGAFLLAVGVGAILQVAYEVTSMVRRQGTLLTPVNLLALLVGFVVMYATDLLVAI